MNGTLDPQKLKSLCQAVIRDCGNDTDLPKAKDDDWSRLVNESLPALENYLTIGEPVR